MTFKVGDRFKIVDCGTIWTISRVDREKEVYYFKNEYIHWHNRELLDAKIFLYLGKKRSLRM